MLPPPACAHRRHAALQQFQMPLTLTAIAGIPLGLGDRVETPAVQRAVKRGVVDERVEPAKRGDRGLDHRLGGGGVGAHRGGRRSPCRPPPPARSTVTPQSSMSAATMRAPATPRPPANSCPSPRAAPVIDDDLAGDASIKPRLNDRHAANDRHPAGQTTWSVRGSIRCIWLRSATSGIVSPALPAAAGLTRPQTSTPSTMK